MQENIDAKKKENKITILGLLIILYSMITPIENIFLLLGGGTLSKYLGIIIAPFLIIYLLKRNYIIQPKIIFFLIIFLIYAAISVFYSINPDYSMQGLVTLISLIVLTILFFEAGLNSLELRWVKISNVALMLVVSIYMITDTIIFGTNFGLRSSLSSAIDPNVFASSIAIPVLIVLDWRFKKNIKSNLIFFLIIGVFLMAIVMTGSRGGLLALLLSSFAFIFLHLKKPFMSKILYIFFIGLFILLPLYLFMNIFLPDIASRFTLESVLSTGGTGRTKIWENYLNIFSKSYLSNIFFGNGYYSHGYVYESVFGKVVASHNEFISFLIDFGLFGLIIIIAIYFVILKQAYQTRNIIGISIVIALVAAGFGLDIIFRKFFWNAIFIVILESQIKLEVSTQIETDTSTTKNISTNI